ncbi:hypothetical protein, partial [Chamaesiphon polymorphus]|uniref:hypothetical protein n=1 Tax=Chamaesiphon polymorphus TaxID=2107691 RepID=UPI001C632157
MLTRSRCKFSIHSSNRGVGRSLASILVGDLPSPSGCQCARSSNLSFNTYGSLIFREGHQIVAQGKYKSQLES